MKTLVKLMNSSIGKKVLMAVTGAVWIGFLPIHLLGNLQIFAGPEAMNQYAFNLQNMGVLKWIARGIFLISIVLHIILAISIKRENYSARPLKYKMNSTVRASIASRSMAVSGIVIFSFLIYHILHYTLGTVHPEYYGHMDQAGRHDVFSMMVNSFQNPIISLIYILSLLLVALHLSHAFSSMFQSLGLNGKYSEIIWRKTGYVFAAAILAGFISIPLGVLFGVIY